MIEIFFTILIGILFFWDLVIFYKKENLKLHRILVPTGLLGSLVYIYLSHEKLEIAIKNSLVILIISLLAFLIIIAIKLFLTKNKIEEKPLNIDKILNNLTIKDELNDVINKIDIKDDLISFEEKLNYILDKIETFEKNHNLAVQINETKISELEENIEFWMKRFDEDSKIFHSEAMALKNENKKQLALILKLLTMSSNKFATKIEEFEIQLKRIENKKITIDDNIVNNITEKTISYLNHIKIEISNIKNNFDEIYSKENNLFLNIEKIEQTFKNIDSYLNNLNKSFEKIDVLDDKFLYTLNEFNKIKTEYENIIKELNISKYDEEIINKLEELKNILESNKKTTQNPKSNILENSIALKNYQENLK